MRRILPDFFYRKPQAQPPVPQGEPEKEQTRSGFADPFFSSFNSYQPLVKNITLYQTIREAIPFFDVAIIKLKMLTGDFEYTSPNETLQKKLTDFKNNVRVDWFGNGLLNLIYEMMDSILETGMSFIEVIPMKSMTDLHRIKVCKVTDLGFIVTEDGQLIIGAYDENRMQLKPLERPDYVHYLAFDQRQGHPEGYSLLYSCVYPSQVLVRWEKAFENYTQRFGDISLVGIFKGGQNTTATEIAKAKTDFLSQLSKLWQERRQGKAADLAMGIPGGGDASIVSLGSDAKTNFSVDAIRMIVEQLIAKTGLLPYQLGISWSTTERMAKDQADILQANIKWYRLKLNNVIKKITDTYLMLSGDAGGEYDIDWGNVLLLDETEQARANFDNAAADEKKLTNLALMIDYGFADETFVEEYLEREGLKQAGLKLKKDWWHDLQRTKYIRQIIREFEWNKSK